MNMGDNDRVSAVARMKAHKKKAPKASAAAAGQATLNLAAAGEKEPDEEEPIDIGGEEELDESMIEDDD